MPRPPGGPGASHPGSQEMQRAPCPCHRSSQVLLGGLRGHGHVCWGLCATPGWSDPPGSASLVALGDLKHSRPHPIYSSLAHPRLLPTGSSSPFPGSEARNTSRATTGCSRGSAPGPGHPKMGVPHCWDPPLIQAATNLGQRRGTPGSIHPFLTMEGQPQGSGYGSGYPSGHPARPQSSPLPPHWSQRTQA